jgi:hypothetical protein
MMKRLIAGMNGKIGIGSEQVPALVGGRIKKGTVAEKGLFRKERASLMLLGIQS